MRGKRAKKKRRLVGRVLLGRLISMGLRLGRVERELWKFRNSESDSTKTIQAINADRMAWRKEALVYAHRLGGRMTIQKIEKYAAKHKTET